MYSCFHFEGQNGILKNLIHGTQKVDLQLLSSYSYLTNVPIAADSVDGTDFLESLSIPQYNCLEISKYVHLLGKPNNATIVGVEKYALAACGYGGDNYKVYTRMLFKNQQL